MRTFSLVIVLVIILTAGCQAGPAALDQAATMIAQTVTAAPPAATASSTSTPAPSDTPAPKPTATPYLALTATREAFEVLSELDVQVGENSAIPYDTGYLAWQQTKPVVIEMSGPQKDSGILRALDENIDGANFIFKSDVTWNASGVLICGVAFRAEPDLNKGWQYQFYFYRLSGLPAYLIDVYEFGRRQYTVLNTKYSDTLDVSNGGTNQFVLTAQNNKFNIYINGKDQGLFIDENQQRHSNGLFAFMAWQESGKGTCTFENSWVWVIP